MLFSPIRRKLGRSRSWRPRVQREGLGMGAELLPSGDGQRTRPLSLRHSLAILVPPPTLPYPSLPYPMHSYLVLV
jgi:hypothetical protein